MTNRYYFVGLGKRTNQKLKLNPKDSEKVNREKIREFLRNFKGTTLGLWKNEEGILYVEPSIIFKKQEEGATPEYHFLDAETGVSRYHEQGASLESLKAIYTEEEAFYEAEIKAYERACYGSNYALRVLIEQQLNVLKENEGLTLTFLGNSGYWYRVVTCEGILIPNKELVK